MPGGQRRPSGHQAPVRQLRTHRRGQLGHRLCAGGNILQSINTLFILIVPCHYPGRLPGGVRQGDPPPGLDHLQPAGGNMSCLIAATGENIYLYLDIYLLLIYLCSRLALVMLNIYLSKYAEFWT